MQQQQGRAEQPLIVRKYPVGRARLICGGLLAISVVIVQVFISTGVFTSSKALDIPALISVLAFALALPLLSLRLLVTFEDASRKFTIKDTLGLKATYWLGILAAPVGIVAAFWHISLFAGILVLVSIIVGVVFYAQYARRLQQLDSELKKATPPIENLGKVEFAFDET